MSRDSGVFLSVCSLDFCFCEIKRLLHYRFKEMLQDRGNVI